MNFNPRPRKEGDVRPNDFTKSFGNFNPRPRKEGDLVHNANFVANFRFQSTPSQRGRLTAFFLLSARRYFNPRPRKEGDKSYILLPIVTFSISIHALAKRATSSLTVPVFFTVHFNPRPRKEGDWVVNFNTPSDSHFNPRPRKEGDTRLT